MKERKIENCRRVRRVRRVSGESSSMVWVGVREGGACICTCAVKVFLME